MILSINAKHLTKATSNHDFKKYKTLKQKTSEEPELEGNFHNVKNTYKKPTPNIMLLVKKPDAFHPIS